MVWPFKAKANRDRDDAQGTTVTVGTEREPLLGGDGDGTPSRVPDVGTESSSGRPATTPLPWRQLLIICAMRTSEPICICIVRHLPTFWRLTELLITQDYPFYQ